MNRNMMILAIGAAAYFLLFRKPSPAFHDETGKKITEIQCGKVIYFNVPGYSAVWLDQLQNGQLQWNAPIEIPYGPHTLNCSSEPGHYQSAVYELKPDWTKGNLIGLTELRVLA